MWELFCKAPAKKVYHYALLICCSCFLSGLIIILAKQFGFPGRHSLWTKILHELSLMLNMIEIAEEHARREDATTITSVTVEIGALSGVIPDAMEFAFEACSKGTLADGATLKILCIPAIGRCQKCAKECAMESLLDGCPECGSYALDIMKGQEMALTELEVD